MAGPATRIISNHFPEDTRIMRSPCRLPSRTRRTLSCLWLLAALHLAGLSSCRRESAPQAGLPSSPATAAKLERDHFAVAIDFLKQRDEHNLDRSAGQTNYYLNRWIRDQAADPRWMIDRPMINTLPDAIKRAPATKEIFSDRALLDAGVPCQRRAVSGGEPLAARHRPVGWPVAGPRRVRCMDQGAAACRPNRRAA